MKYPAGTLLLTALLSGCGGVLTSDDAPLREYWLAPEAGLLQPAPELGAMRLRVTVAAPRGMDRRELLHLEPTSQLREYAGARWTDDAPSVVASYLELALEQALGLAATDNEDDRQATLMLELRSLYTRATASGDQALLDVVTRVDCRNDTSARRITLVQRVTGGTLAAVVAAHRQNLDGFSQDVRDQLVATCAR